jgi:hypothetical protein
MAPVLTHSQIPGNCPWFCQFCERWPTEEQRLPFKLPRILRPSGRSVTLGLMDEVLDYFRRAVKTAEPVPSWSEWWTSHEEAVAASFSLVDYVRLKHRRLLGARQILQRIGELPESFVPPDPAVSGRCFQCGEQVVAESPSGGIFKCSVCGTSASYETSRS